MLTGRLKDYMYYDRVESYETQYDFDIQCATYRRMGMHHHMTLEFETFCAAQFETLNGDFIAIIRRY